MEYVELKYIVGSENEGLTEEIMAILSEFGYESFVEENDKLLAYIPALLFDSAILNNKELWPDSLILDNFSWKEIPEQNWNAVWEENFQPVTIAGKCHIRAPFHEPNNQVPYEIIIEPKMSFGTAHHETTAQMIEYLIEIDLSGKKVLDMGCGTGILAILAALRGAIDIVAIDIDEWAYNNSIENIERNNTTSISVLLGDASLLKDQKFNTIIANINRNILLNDIPVYAECLDAGGLLLLSGFYIDDLPVINQMAGSAGLTYTSHKEQNKWVAACFEKSTG